MELVDFMNNVHEMTKITIVLIEHHLEVVMNVCKKINVLNLGSMLFTGTPEEVQNSPEVIRAYIGERKKTQS